VLEGRKVGDLVGHTDFVSVLGGEPRLLGELLEHARLADRWRVVRRDARRPRRLELAQRVEEGGELRSSTRPQLQIATRPPLRVTRAASANAATKSAANWKALKPVTTSKLRSLHGSCSIGPTRRSASGSRRLAITTMPLAASMPLTGAASAAAS
jgi:hypothetical protein